MKKTNYKPEKEYKPTEELEAKEGYVRDFLTNRLVHLAPDLPLLKNMSKVLKIYRALYEVDDKTKTYRYYARNPDWENLSKEEAIHFLKSAELSTGKKCFVRHIKRGYNG